MIRIVLFAAALILAPLSALSQGAAPFGDREPFSAAQDGKADAWREVLERLSQSNPELGQRITGAIDTVREACASDVSQFCGTVTPGEGHLLLCMRAHEDQLSRRCEFALYRVARNVGGAVDRIAGACLNDIQAQCGTADRVGPCVMQKSASFSPECQTVIAALRRTAQAVLPLKGMGVFSSDDKNVGQVVEAVRGSDGTVQSIQIDVGRALGLGSKVLTVNAAQFQQLPDRIKLRLQADQIRSLPEMPKQ
jgi:Golgi apparatus protein 1